MKYTHIIKQISKKDHFYPYRDEFLNRKCRIVKKDVAYFEWKDGWLGCWLDIKDESNPCQFHEVKLIDIN